MTIAQHDDVEPSEWRLIRPPVFDLVRQQDEAGARPQRRVT